MTRRPISFLPKFKDVKGDQRGCCFCGRLSRISAAVASLLFLGLLLCSTWIALHSKQKVLRWSSQRNLHKLLRPCENKWRPPGSETLPEGIVAKTSNFETRPLWGLPKRKRSISRSLFAVAVGIKQKQNVDRMVQKFLGSNFVVMLFHYDGIVDEWRRSEWSNRVIHVSVDNQTKWWFAKRFLHPDMVAEYDYVFLWDEDLGVENFNPNRYLRIVKEEGLEISQPALDPKQSKVHHLITARWNRSKLHRRSYGVNKGIKCDERSSTPPCTGWIEVMAPVFSNAAWRCVWYLIQNDFIHAWGLDMRLGHCAQGDRTKKIGVVDSEYIVHYGYPTLGKRQDKNNKIKESSPPSNTTDTRMEVRIQSYNEYKLFRRRWKAAAEKDECWKDLYPDDDHALRQILP